MPGTTGKTARKKSLARFRPPGVHAAGADHQRGCSPSPGPTGPFVGENYPVPAGPFGTENDPLDHFPGVPHPIPTVPGPAGPFFAENGPPDHFPGAQNPLRLFLLYSEVTHGSLWRFKRL